MQNALLRIRFLCLTLILAVSQSLCAATLRIVTYNTRNSQTPYSAPSSESVILKGIGQESVNGTSRPIDILCIEEQNNTTSTSTQSYLNIMNALYGAGHYAKGSLVTGASTSPNTDSG